MRVADRTDTGLDFSADVTGAAFSLDHMTGYSITVSASETVATMAGTLKLQASNNAFDGNVNNTESSSAVWVDISGASQSVSGTGDFVWNVDGAHYRAVRYVYTRSTGSGTATAYIHAKGPQS